VSLGLRIDDCTVSTVDRGLHVYFRDPDGSELEFVSYASPGSVRSGSGADDRV
jgi:hypothetical protein